MSYTAVPNWLIDQAGDLTAAAFKVAIVICRLTIGWQKDTDDISLTRLQALTKLSRPTLIAALRDLTGSQVVECVGTGRRGMSTYRLVKKLDQLNSFTSKETLPLESSSAAEPVKELYQSETEPVKKLYTQKKDSSTTTNVVVAAAEADRTELAEPNCENEQLTLVGCPEPPPPSCAAPPPPPKPARQRKTNPPEAKALYPAIFELCKSGQKGEKGMACRNLARDLWREFEATPEQAAAFWDWFKVFSRPAQMAARERRPVNAPMPRQVYADWPQFLQWWQAKQAQAARDAERRAQDEQARAATPPTVEDAPRLSGRELYRRTFGLPRPELTLTAD